MARERTEEFYIKKYGEPEGRQRFREVVAERERRRRRVASGKSIVATIDLSSKSNQAAALQRGDAVECLECGYVGTRLQHTHFKYKCSGRFANGREYKQVFPGAAVVAPNLAKKTGGTLQNYIALYGESEGNSRWELYKQRQAASNSLEYKLSTHGWTKEQFDSYNSSRSSTLKNFISRHGEQEGMRRWDEYVARQRETTSERYFIETYGIDEGSRRFWEWDKARSRVGGMQQSAIELACYTVLSTVLDGLQLAVSIDIGKKSKPFDYGSIPKKKLIEFYGTFWHADPRVWDPTAYHDKKRKFVSEIWQHDNFKRQSAIDIGFEVFVIWESDWRTQKQAVLEKVKDWWYADSKSSDCND